MLYEKGTYESKDRTEIFQEVKGFVAEYSDTKPETSFSSQKLHYVL